MKLIYPVADSEPYVLVFIYLWNVKGIKTTNNKFYTRHSLNKGSVLYAGNAPFNFASIGSIFLFHYFWFFHCIFFWDMKTYFWYPDLYSFYTFICVSSFWQVWINQGLVTVPLICLLRGIGRLIAIAMYLRDSNVYFRENIAIAISVFVKTSINRIVYLRG